MIVHDWAETGAALLTDAPQAATVGVFDGVHRGHQKLLAELAGPGLQTLVVTFRGNPKAALGRPFAGALMTWDEKVAALEGQGVTRLVAIDFSPQFSTMTGRDFFIRLKRSFVFSRLVLGWNFSFGKDSSSGAAELGWLADPETRLSIVAPLEVDGRVVSSSAVRQAVSAGDLALACSLLGRPYAVTLVPPFREGEGRQGLPKDRLGKVLPPPGRYPGRVDGQRTAIHVDEGFFSWESPPGRRSQLIVFD